MKRSILIISGALILFILVGIWVYLLFFGTPKNTGEVFANLGFTGSTERTELPPDTTPLPETIPEVLPPLKALRQLTLRPAAGVFVPNEIKPEYIRFVERGTGHIYEIDITTGRETQVTKVTTPQVVEAVFSPEGTSVIMTAYLDDIKSSNVLLLTEPSGETEVTDIIPLPPGANNVAFADEETVLYTLSDSSGTAGYRYRTDTKARTEFFKVPLTQVQMVWGDGRTGTYLYTRPSQHLDGFAYEVRGSTLRRLGPGMPGLTYARNNAIEIRSAIADHRTPYSEFTLAGEFEAAPAFFLPEKCTFVDAESLRFWCAANMEQTGPSFIEDWYRGSVTSSDGLWRIDTERGEVWFEVDLAAESGRTIDVQTIEAAGGGLLAFFINKIDGTVWVYDILIAEGIAIN